MDLADIDWNSLENKQLKQWLAEVTMHRKFSNRNDFNECEIESRMFVMIKMLKMKNVIGVSPPETEAYPSDWSAYPARSPGGRYDF